MQIINIGESLEEFSLAEENQMSAVSGKSPDLRSLLSSFSREELEQIVRRRLEAEDEDIRELVLSHWEKKTNSRSADVIVKRMMDRFRKRSRGYVNDTTGLADDLITLYRRADETLREGERLFAVRLLTAAVESAAPFVYENSDDEGELLSAVDEGFGRLSDIARATETDPDTLRGIGIWAARCMNTEWAREGDSWDLSCLDLVAESARDEVSVYAALKLCSHFTKNPRPDWSWTYRANHAALTAVGLLSGIGNAEARQKYIKDHLDLSGMRDLAIDQAAEAGDYPRALELCREGARLSAETRAYGMTEQYRNLLVKILDQAGESVEATREFEVYVSESFTMKGFMALKERFSDRDTWQETRDRIINKLKTEKSSTHELADIYEAEEMHEPLLALAERNAYLFRAHLEAIGRFYPEQAAAFLRKWIEGELTQNRSRNAYISLAGSIIRYGIYAGPEASEALFVSLVAAYPSRRAMREEFDRARRENREIIQ